MLGRLPYLVVGLSLPLSAFAQFSGYGSASYGSDSNPLRNFAELHDNLTQGYLEMRFRDERAKSALDAAYAGGLMMFRDLEPRNYYEHSLTVRQSLWLSDRPGGPSAPPDSATEADDTGDSATTADSTGSMLSLILTGSARHDKEVYNDYDNYAVGFTPAYRWESSDRIIFRARNDLVYRNYMHLTELSNVTDAVTFSVEHSSHPVWRYGIFLGGAIKHYTVSSYDTTMFETARTFVTKSSGKGKGGALLRIPSTKKILVNPQANTTYSVTAGLLTGATWSSGFLKTTIELRYSPGPANRYLAQHANTGVLNQDIYGESFGVNGGDIAVSLTQALPLGFRLRVDAVARRWDYGVPALTLAGTATGTDRRDDHAEATVGISRYVDVAGDFGFEVGIEGLVLRNRSNDEYNNYSASSILVQLGIGI